MAKLKAQKVKSNATNGYTETTKFEILHQANVETNHNKFYCLELQKNPSTNKYRLFSHYGRLGKTNMYDVRPAPDLQTAEKEFESILKKKKKGKRVKDKNGNIAIENYEKIETSKPTVGSENICGQSVEIEVKSNEKNDTSSYGDREVTRIINQIVDENIHNVTLMTTLKLTANGFETPLGPVTQQHIDKARIPLDTLRSNLKNGQLNEHSKIIRDCNNNFFSLIPHPFSHKIQKSDWILDDQKLLEEYDLLDQLSSAIQMGSAMKNVQQRKSALGSDIERVTDKKELNRIKKYFKNSRARNHKNIWNYNVKNAFKIKIPSERKRFENCKDRYGNIKELFHGSRNCNILSILKKGLIIPPCSAPGVTGRMFGNGVYFAHNSTKALNYSIGFWAGTRNKYSNTFLFLANVAMGKVYDVKQALGNGAPRGYNSIHAHKGYSLYNDEYIVYSLEQQSLTYLLELQN